MAIHNDQSSLKRILAIVPPQIHRAAKIAAAEEEVSLSDFARQAIVEKLARREDRITAERRKSMEVVR